MSFVANTSLTITLKVPTLNDDKADFIRMFGLWQQIRPSRICGGTGLDSLKKFVKSKQGRIEVYSHDAYGLIDETQEIYQSAPTFFEGTLINITIKCDVNHHNFTENEVLF